jgi:hypothetical protein
MKILYLIEYFIICATFSALAQVDNSVMKPDSIPVTQNEPAELLSSQPLSNKTFGIEFNPIRLLYGLTGDVFDTQIHGGVSLFSIDRHAEIAFPLLYMVGKKDDIPLKVLNIDATYRRFFHKKQKGIFISGGLRYTFVEGEEGLDNRDAIHSGNIIKENKVGIYIGVGYRYFSHSGFYWGTNIIFGRYLTNDNHPIMDITMSDLKIILGVELMKIGYAF